MNLMKNNNKIVVETDSAYISSYYDTFQMADSLAFLIPTILLSEKYNIDRIYTGDILASFTRRFHSQINDDFIFYSCKDIFESIGITIDYPLNGATELITLSITNSNSLLDESASCTLGKFKKPCFKCEKCIRKSIYKLAMFDKKISKKQYKSILNSKYYLNMITNDKLDFQPILNYAINQLNEYDKKILHKLVDKFQTNIPTDFAFKLNPLAYKNRVPEVMEAINKISGDFDFYSDDDLDNYKSFLN